MRQALFGEAEQLRDATAVVGAMAEAALDHGLDRRLVDGCASVFRERVEGPRELELERSVRTT